MSSIRVSVVPCLTDNFAYLVRCVKTGATAVVDPSEAKPIFDALGERGRLDAVWATHHHFDHVGGIAELLGRFDVPVVGHASESARIPKLSKPVNDGDSFSFGELIVSVLHVPGHTTGAIAFVVRGTEGANAVFTGDTLFLSGCGRMFEGTPDMMATSMQRLAGLDGDTEVYCGHEYTEANLRFAAHIEPKNERVAALQVSVRAARARGEPSVPSTIERERAANPFLRLTEGTVKSGAHVPDDADASRVFAALRSAKDSF